MARRRYPAHQWGPRCQPDWTPAQRLAHRTSRDPLSGCVLWQGPATASGYGRLRLFGRAWLAHRLAWTEAHGPIPPGMMLCHRCDERRCVNPDHLFLGTHHANMADLKAKRLRRHAAADTGRMHIFIRGLELVGDVTWEKGHDFDSESPITQELPRARSDEEHGALHRRGPPVRPAERP